MILWLNLTNNHFTGHFQLSTFKVCFFAKSQISGVQISFNNWDQIQQLKHTTERANQSNDLFPHTWHLRMVALYYTLLCLPCLGKWPAVLPLTRLTTIKLLSFFSNKLYLAPLKLRQKKRKLWKSLNYQGTSLVLGVPFDQLLRLYCLC